MTRQELVDKICAKNKHLQRPDVEQVIRVIFDTMSDALAEDKSVALRGLGTFCIKERSARIARNPKTGEFVKVAAKKIPSFKPGKKIHKLLNPDES